LVAFVQGRFAPRAPGRRLRFFTQQDAEMLEDDLHNLKVRKN